MLWQPIPDPIQVIVEQSGSSLWTDWGPLIGVVVGAILGALGQIVAGRLQRRHDDRRDQVAVKRVLYGRLLNCVDDVASSLASMSVTAQGHSTGSLADASDRLVETANRLSALLGEVGIVGSLDVYSALAALLDDLGLGNEPGDWRAWDQEWRTIGKHKASLMAVMRLDLGTPGPIPSADSTRTAINRKRPDLGSHPA